MGNKRPGISPAGPAGGDLSGTYPNPSVTDDSHNHTAATLPATMPPSAHASTHEDGGSDEISVAGLSGVLADNQNAVPAAGIDTSALHLPIAANLAMATYRVTGLGDPVDSQDAVTLAYFQANDCQKYLRIIAKGLSEGDLHLSDGATWNVDKALIKAIRVITASTDWDLYLLQNDNGHAADDAWIPEMQIMEAGNGDAVIQLDYPFEDEDASGEVHLYYLDNSGANTADIYIFGLELR